MKSGIDNGCTNGHATLKVEITGSINTYTTMGGKEELRRFTYGLDRSSGRETTDFLVNLSPAEIKDLRCITHNDWDGYASAAVLIKGFGVEKDQITVCNYANKGIPYDKLVGHHVVITDYSLQPEEFEKIASSALSVTIFDHHKTSLNLMEIVEQYGKIIDVRVDIDMDRCGAKICYEDSQARIGTTYMERETASKFITLVDDYDRWVKAYHESDKLCKYFYDSNKDGVGSPLYGMMTDQVAIIAAIRFGERLKAVSQERNAILNEAFAFDAKVQSKDGDVVLKVQAYEGYGNSENFPNIKSFEAVCLYHQNKDGSWTYSLYTVNDAPVLRVAESYGGGGHPSACGFTLDHLIF